MTGETILCVAPRTWDSLWRESQQVMSRLASDNTIIYVEPARDWSKGYLEGLLESVRKLLRPRVRRVRDNILLVTGPMLFPIGARYLPRPAVEKLARHLFRLNCHLERKYLQNLLKAMGVREPIVWLFGSHLGPLVGRLGEKLVCYHNYDEFPEMARNRPIRDLLYSLDDNLSRQVDVIFATSRSQYNRRRRVNSSTYLVPNGVDFELFNRPMVEDVPLPADLRAIPKPIIGFAGWLGYHVDVQLLLRLAVEHSDCSLVLVGPDELPKGPATRALKARLNVFFLGSKPHRILPAYVQAFDVAILPYVIDVGHVRHAYPLKLHEYLAAGRAVVSVALPELQPYRDVVRITSSGEEFSSAVADALGDQTLEAVQRRVAVARENTWDHRVTEMRRILDRHLATSVDPRSEAQSPRCA